MQSATTAPRRRVAAVSRHLTTAPLTPGAIPDPEWELRCKLAAAYRIAGALGWDQVIFNHITARVPASEEAPDGPHFLINPLGLRFDEVTASSLLRVTVDGVVLDNPLGAGGLFRQGFVIHAAVHKARHDAVCVWHCHHEDTAAICMTRRGLLPLSQEAVSVYDEIAYHPFEGTANDLSEQDRIEASLGQHKNILLLENHGPLVLGSSVEMAFSLMYSVCRACTYQQKALAAVGGDVNQLLVPSQRSLNDMRDRARLDRGRGQSFKDGGEAGSHALMFRAMARLVEDKAGGPGAIYC
jgi:adducin